MSVEIENIRKDLRMRVETDSMMSSAWILVGLIPLLLVIFYLSFFILLLISIVMGPIIPPSGELVSVVQFVPLFLSIAFIYLLAIINIVFSIILIYKLVKRRNTHFRRQIFLFEDVVAAVKAIAAKKGVAVEVDLASSERTLREARAEETEKDAVPWAILSVFIFLVEWYVRYFLMKDFYKHERREDGFWRDVSKILDKFGVTFSLPIRTQALPERSFALYLILTVITLGFFGIYWLYVLLKDPNQHFKYHVRIEDQLLDALESVAI